MNTQSKWIQVLHSRTVGVLFLLFATDTVSVLGAHIQPELLVLINLSLTSLATYLHVNPPVQGLYTPAGTPAPATPPLVFPSTVPIVSATPGATIPPQA
jgi:hypothetical protein